MAMAWVRLYVSILEDPRFHRMPASLFRSWAFLLALARKNDGHIPDVDDLAFALRTSTEQTAADMERLISYGLMDKTATGFTPHDWQRWQYEYPSQTPEAKRVQKRAERGRKNVSSDRLGGRKAVGSPDTDQTTDADADAEKNALVVCESFADEPNQDTRNHPMHTSTSDLMNATEPPANVDIFWRWFPLTNALSDTYEDVLAVWGEINPDPTQAREIMEGLYGFAANDGNEGPGPAYEPTDFLRERPWKHLPPYESTMQWRGAADLALYRGEELYKELTPAEKIEEILEREYGYLIERIPEAVATQWVGSARAEAYARLIG